MKTALTNRPTFYERLLRLRPALFSELAIRYICDAETNPRNPAYPPRAQWCSVLRGLRVRFDTPGWVEDVTAFLGGETTARTYAEIAAAFEVSTNTVKNSWASTGMPRDGGAPYSLVEILAWRLAADRLADINQKRID